MVRIDDPELLTYCIEHSTPEPASLRALRETTEAKTTMPQMMVGPLEGGLLRLLVRLSRAKRVLEVGTFTGYSALTMAAGLPEDGELVTLDIDPESANIASDFWQQSRHGSKIVQVLGDARETLPRMEGPFDMVFIDADKAGYITYWETALPLVRQGGLIVVDNVLWNGKVLDPDSEDAAMIAAFNAHVQEDDRVETVILPVRDGILLAIKR